MMEEGRRMSKYIYNIRRCISNNDDIIIHECNISKNDIDFKILLDCSRYQ